MSGKGAILGIVGGIAGFILTGGNPAGAVVGFALGMGIGMAMDATTADAPDTPGQGQINKMDIPTCNFGDPLPDFIGTVKMTGNIIQSWGHRVEEQTEQQSVPGGKAGGGESSQTVVVGYKNYLSWLHSFAYGFGPATTLYTVLFDEKVVYYGTLTDTDLDGEETIQLGDPSGEVLGSMTFYFGRDDQTANAKAATALDDPTLASAYRGLVYAMFDDVMIGSYARAPSVKVVVGKHPIISDIGDTPLEIVNTLDYNPAHAIWYLTEKHTGMSASFLNAASFIATAVYLKNTDFPGVGISMFINRQVTAETYIEAIMSHCGLSLVEIEGELHLGVLRNDVLTSAMDTITDTESLDIPSLTIGSWEDTYNDVKINYSKVNHLAYIYACGEIAGSETDKQKANDEDVSTMGIHCFDNIYCVSEVNGSNNLVLRTFQVDNDGEISAELDNYEYASAWAASPFIMRVWELYGSSILVNHSDGPILTTFRVSLGGLITPIDEQNLSGGVVGTNLGMNGLARGVSDVVIGLAGGSTTYLFTARINVGGTIDTGGVGIVKDTYNLGAGGGSDVYTGYSFTPSITVTVGLPAAGGVSLALRSFYIGAGGDIAYLDEFTPGLGINFKFDDVLLQMHPIWQGLGLLVFENPPGAYALYTVGFNAGYFDASNTDRKPITGGLDPARYPLMRWMGGDGVLCNWTHLGVGWGGNWIGVAKVNYDGTLQDNTALPVAQKIANSAGGYYRMRPVLINRSTGEWLFQWTDNLDDTYLQTWNISSKCGDE